MKQYLTLSVFGLGKLGCTMLACFADKGWNVIGMDINEEFVSKINNSESPIYEPGVDELIKANKERISATLDSKEAIENSDVSFVIVPTPSTDMGYFATKYVEAVAAEIGSVLRTKEKYHLVVITSTVLPGDMDKIVNLIEKTSAKKLNINFGVCYNPDFIALGTVVKNFLNPDIVLIGESNSKAGELLESIHHNLVENSPNIHRMNFHNAELTKIALNSYCTLKITFANVLAEFCEKMPGGNVDAVTNALGDDCRIGHKYLKGGLSYGGPCFPRDNRAFSFSAKKYNVENNLALKIDKINDYHRNERVPQILLNLLNKASSKKLSILGLTYKNDTTLIEESAVIYIIKSLSSFDIDIKVYDPAGMEEAKIEFENIKNVSFAKTSKECIRDTDVCFIGTLWDEFKKLSEDDFLSEMNKPIIFDSWNLYNFDKNSKVDYQKIGTNLLDEL